MKIIIALILVLLCFISGCTQESEQLKKEQVYCPRGISNDPYPGQCGNYIDVNKNRICDLGE